MASGDIPSRRLVLGAAGAAWLAGGLGRARRAWAAEGLRARLAPDLARIETGSGGRLGVAVLDTGTGERAGHREHERFPLCSTFKLLAAAAVLARVDAGQDRLDRRIAYDRADLVAYSPVTGPRVGEGGLTLAELCEAAMILSDNTAGNLLLAALGGPAGLTAYARSLGDETTRLDRIEPELNEALPGDPRDTTTPAAMLANLETLLLGDALRAASRERLTRWMLDSRTGGARLKAGLPSSWRVGDKTGTGERGTANDVAVAWPTDRPPVLVAAYLTEATAAPEGRNAALAGVGVAIAAALAGRGGPR